MTILNAVLLAVSFVFFLVAYLALVQWQNRRYPFNVSWGLLAASAAVIGFVLFGEGAFGVYS